MNISLLDKEINLFKPLLTALLVCSLSGLIIYLDTSLAWWAQFNVLGHIFYGILLSLISLPYIHRHFRRTLGIRKPLTILTGIVAATFFISFLLAGLYLAIFGHQESQSFLLLIHRIGSIVLVGLIAIHIFIHRKSASKKPRIEFHSLKSYQAKQGLIALGRYTIIVAFLAASYAFYHSPPAISPITQTYEYQYGDHPFRPSQTETNNNNFIAENQIAGSDECAFCHSEIATQWQSSVHRHAASDPAYVTNINLLEKSKGISSTRYCEGCHAPIALLTGQLTSGGKHGGISNTKANEEGVSCLSCHRITRAVHLDGVASYLYEPASEYLFQYSDSKIPRMINRYLIKTYSRQHQNDMNQPVLSQATQCATCHAQFMDKDMNNWGWVKMQDDYSAWLNSPYSKQHEQDFSSKNLLRCQDCHMPLVNASDPSANNDGMVRSHRFIAANTMVPLLNNDMEQLALTKDFLRSNKMNITIDNTNRQTATQSSLNIEESLRLHQQKPSYYYLGEKIDLKVIVSNTGVGHDFPAGTIDINQAWVHLNVKDAEGRVVFESGSIDENDQLDSASHRYDAIPIDRQGKAVWKHDLFNMTGEAYRNVIKAGKSDVVNYAFEIPYWSKGPLIADALLKYRKLNTRYAKWALQERYQALPIVTMAKDSQIIEIRHEPAAVAKE